MKGQDIVILLKLASLGDREACGCPGDSRAPSGGEAPYSVRGLEASLGISKTEVSASLSRSITSGLAFKSTKSTQAILHRKNLCEFLIHGLKYVFPAKPGALSRGYPTSIFAPIIKHSIISGSSLIFVWPAADAKQQGLAITPLFKTVPKAIQQDDLLYEYLALVDAIRIGRQRETRFAAERLSAKLLSPC